MNMIGNTLQKNGTYVYIDPIAIGAGSSRAIGGIPNIARLIGLGGYFLVNAVKNEVSPSGFTTTVDAMQEMSSFDSADDDKIVAINGQPPVSVPPPPDKDPGEGCVDWDTTEGPGNAGPPAAAELAGDDTGTIVEDEVYTIMDFQSMKQELLDAGVSAEESYDIAMAAAGAFQSIDEGLSLSEEDQAAMDAYNEAVGQS